LRDTTRASLSHVGLTRSKSFAAIGIAATARSADDGARCASNEPSFTLDFQKKTGRPDFKKAAKDPAVVV
jgi:hypothetical protein